MVTLAKICFFQIAINRAKIPLYQYANFLRNLNISDQTRDAQNICTVTKGGAILKLITILVNI